jgi:hypothetical protein
VIDCSRIIGFVGFVANDMHGFVTIFECQYLGFSHCKAYKEVCCKAIKASIAGDHIFYFCRLMHVQV